MTKKLSLILFAFGWAKTRNVEIAAAIKSTIQLLSYKQSWRSKHEISSYTLQSHFWRAMPTIRSKAASNAAEEGDAMQPGHEITEWKRPWADFE